MKKQFLKAGLIYGLIMGVFFATMMVIPVITKGILHILARIATGMLIGLISGILFGLLIGLFAKWQAKKFQKKRDEIVKEYDIVFDDAANHFVGKEGVGGWLFLTTDNLLFKSHNFNVQNHELIIQLSSIKSVAICKLLFVFNTGLMIEMDDDVVEKFTVNNPKKWVEVINNSIKNKA